MSLICTCCVFGPAIRIYTTIVFEGLNDYLTILYYDIPNGITKIASMIFVCAVLTGIFYYPFAEGRKPLDRFPIILFLCLLKGSVEFLGICPF